MTLEEELKARIFTILMEVRIPLPFLWEGNNVIEMAPFTERSARLLAERLVEEAGKLRSPSAPIGG